MATVPTARPRRRRGVAFFEPVIHDSDSSTESERKFAQKAIPTPPSSTATKLLLFAALPTLLFIVYLLIPTHEPSPYGSTTPLTPFLTSLTAQTTISPAVAFTGLAIHMFRTALYNITDVPSDLVALADRTQVLVETLTMEETGFKTSLHESLDNFVKVSEWTRYSLKEGYDGFLDLVEINVESLVQSTGELGLVLGQLKGEVGAFQRKTGNADVRFEKSVEWVKMVVGRVDVGYKDALAKAQRSRKAVKSLSGEGWMRDGLAKREVEEIKKYREAEKKADELVHAIAVELMEGEVEGLVEGKLGDAMLKGEINWW